jgi:CheY-like chemotaxis protein
MLTLCLDRWATVQIEQAIQEQSQSHLAAPAPISSTPPKQTQSTPSTSLQSEPSLSVTGVPSSPSPNPSNQRQQSEDQPPPPSKPLEAEPPRHAAGLDHTAQVAPFLLVDDNDVNLKLLSAYLSRKSFPFTTAVDGILAVEAYKAARGNFSCVFMDIQMPRMDGITATRMIREFEREEELEAVMVVALTGIVTEEKQREAEACGINKFFAKPVRLNALDVILERTARAVS